MVIIPVHFVANVVSPSSSLNRESRLVAAGKAKPLKACRRISRTLWRAPGGRAADGAAARQRTVGDELAAGAAPCPTTRAIRMANALMLERILGTGQFKSPAALAAKLGISRSVVSELLRMQNLPPAGIEMTKVLFETRA